MLPLRSKMTPIDTGTSSDDKFTTSCSMLSSKMRKLLRSRDVTGRSWASVTETLTSAKSTSAWTPSLICWPGVSCLGSLRTGDWADADVPTVEVARPKTSERTTGTNKARVPIEAFFFENHLVVDMRTGLLVGLLRLIGFISRARQGDLSKAATIEQNFDSPDGVPATCSYENRWPCRAWKG